MRRVRDRYRTVLDEQHQNGEPDQPRTEADHEDRVEVAGREPEQAKCDQRPDHRAGRIERAVDAEGQAKRVAVAGERDQRVARGGADPLARPVEEDDRAQRREALDEEQPEARERGEPVTHNCDVLVAARAVGGEATGHADERGRALLEPVHDPELERREAEGVDEVDRQDRRDHLRGDVREQADEPEQDDGAGHLRPRPPPAQPQELAWVEHGVHRQGTLRAFSAYRLPRSGI